MKLLDGKWALVTGASRGIGQRVAVGLAEHGCNLVIHARHCENLRQTHGLLAASEIRCYEVAGELDTQAGVNQVIEAVKACEVGIDVLYNNAAVQLPWQDVWEIGRDTWERTMAINVYALVELCTAFVPAMIERGFGRIVNVSSGIRDLPQLAPYGASKAAVDKYTQDLAAHLRDTNVLINTIDPGWLRTDLGGPQADHDVDSVLPGALVPILEPASGRNGQRYSVQDATWVGDAFRYYDD